MKNKYSKNIDLAAVKPMRYSMEEKVGFLLSNAVDTEDYVAVRKLAKEMNLNPDEVLHRNNQT